MSQLRYNLLLPKTTSRRATKREFQQALSNASVTDFLLVEYRGEMGGRVAHTAFGAKESSYTVELGSNWVLFPRLNGGAYSDIANRSRG